MSFTEDELRAFNSILEQRLTAHRRDMEHMLDLRLHSLQRGFELRLVSVQQEVIRLLGQKFVEQRQALNDALIQKFGVQQLDLTRAMGKEFERWQEQEQQDLTDIVDEALVTRLLAIEQLLRQQLEQQLSEEARGLDEQGPPFEAIEVQTDLPWDDLLAIFGKALDERLATLRAAMQSMVQDTMQAALKDEQQHLVAHLQMLVAQQQGFVPLQPQSNGGNLTTMQEVFNSIEQLERIIESMQVAMTNNHALLANRLFHHQHLPPERAHGGLQPSTTPSSQPNGNASHTIASTSNQG